MAVGNGTAYAVDPSGNVVALDFGAGKSTRVTWGPELRDANQAFVEGNRIFAGSANGNGRARLTTCPLTPGECTVIQDVAVPTGAFASARRLK